jgi:hypothetical protein
VTAPVRTPVITPVSIFSIFMACLRRASPPTMCRKSSLLQATDSAHLVRYRNNSKCRLTAKRMF